MAKKASKQSTTKTSATLTSNPTPSEMKTSEIRDLIDFISQSGLNEVNIETKELKLHEKREPDQKVFKSTEITFNKQKAYPRKFYPSYQFLDFNIN